MDRKYKVLHRLLPLTLCMFSLLFCRFTLANDHKQGVGIPKSKIDTAHHLTPTAKRFSTLKSQISSLKSEEFRGFWADGFNQGYKTPQQIDLLLRRLQQAHCNAIFAQMRKGGDAYYASHYEPWASDDQDHFDALDCLIRKAHALHPPIAVHAWLNVCAVGRNKYALPGHIATLHPDWLSLNTHLEATDPEVAKIDLGDPDAADWTFRTFMDVVRHYPVDGIHLDFVRYSGKRRGYNPVNLARFERRFGRSGVIHRMPGSDLPAPDDPLWKQWRRDQVTAFVRKLYACAVQLNPKIVVSAALIAWNDGPHTEAEWVQKSAAMNLVFQDWRGWLQEGILDLGCPMSYFSAKYGLRDQQDWSEWIKDHQYGRAATVGIGNWENTIPETLTLLQIARRPSAAEHRPYGVMFYSYAGTNLIAPNARGRRRELQLQPDFYAMLGQPTAYVAKPPFPSDVPIPPMPWKAHPTRGHLDGFVLTPTLEPVDGALIEVRSSAGQIYRQRTDGTGFYAFIDLREEGKGKREKGKGNAAHRSLSPFSFPLSPIGEAGSYTVLVTGPDGAVAQQVSIRAGQVSTASFTLGHSSIPLLASFSALWSTNPTAPLSGVGNLSQTPTVRASSFILHPSSLPVRFDRLMVVLGTDTFPGNLYVVDAQGAGIRVRLAAPPILPFQPGDIVSVVGTPGRVENEPALDQATARLTGIAPMSDLPEPIGANTKALAAGKIGTGQAAQVRGVVIATNSEGFKVEDEGAEIEVPLAERKEFSIESTGLQVTLPAVGELVEATGIVSRYMPPDGHAWKVCLLPRSGADVVILSAGIPLIRSAWGRWLILLFVLLIGATVFLWIRRRNNRTLKIDEKMR